MPMKTSSPTLPPYIEQKLNSLILDENLTNSVLALREALLETFYPPTYDRCPMCGGNGLYRYMVGKKIIDEGCDACHGTGHAHPDAPGAARYVYGLEILSGRRLAPDDKTANMSPPELAAAVLDGKILEK